MDAQSIFDKVATHLFTQGVQSKNLEDTRQPCAYRGANGTSCAVGCLIPDELYEPWMDQPGTVTADTCLYEVVSERPAIGDHLNYWVNGDLLNQLQGVHDNDDLWCSTDQMRDQLRLVAERHGLDPSILNTLQFGDR